MLDYFLPYWAVGILFLAFQVITNKNGEAYKISDVFIVLIFAVFWPLFLLLLTYIRLTYKPHEEKVFTVTFEDLGEKMSIAEIEGNHIHADPENAVPNLPFGFLNGTWSSFVDSASSFTYWYFEKLDDSDWTPEFKKGYAKVNAENEVTDYFVFEACDVEK